MISLDAFFQQFLSERHYLQNVSPKTLDWYRTAWKAFGQAMPPAARPTAREASPRAT
jgi:hypothetical protein